MSPLARQVAALLFCAPEPVGIAELADALEVEVQDVDEALAELASAIPLAEELDDHARRGACEACAPARTPVLTYG
jgi:hypothetical protein